MNTYTVGQIVRIVDDLNGNDTLVCYAEVVRLTATQVVVLPDGADGLARFNKKTEKVVGYQFPVLTHVIRPLTHGIAEVPQSVRDNFDRMLRPMTPQPEEPTEEPERPIALVRPSFCSKYIPAAILELFERAANFTDKSATVSAHYWATGIMKAVQADYLHYWEPVLPTVHLGGSPRRHLLEDRSTAMSKLSDVLDALQAMTPHPRDYHINRNGPTYEEALAQHRARVQAITAVRDSIELEAIALSDD